ncbi:leucine-rich repeat protein [Clostridium sp. D53t1_180928_C8]|uniref:leucine-rich repeat protein n=1 Tax=Clostridium sp. D53t1_180928_C8 TaxID=2787101 RepID=UPI0018A939A7|nr:leucine-rich repeat protein [Clostridium sp. D53t1_180928_C8]
MKLDSDFWSDINKIISDSLNKSSRETSEGVNTEYICVEENSNHSNSSDNSYFVFELNKDSKSYTISAKDRLKLPSDLVIPSKYNNLPVTNIKYNGFQSCKTITSVKIPSSVVSIDSLEYKADIGAFSGCSSLSKVYFEKESNIQVIGIRAFAYCIKLEEVYLRCSIVPSLGLYAFYQTSENLKIYVPETMIDKFKNDCMWKAYKENIFKLPSEDCIPEIPDISTGAGGINNGVVITIVKVTPNVYTMSGDINININLEK